MTGLFTPFKLNEVEMKNRIMLSPMCQYQVKTNDGTPNNWHYVHLVSRAVGGVGLICFEMTNVEARGRITEGCLGIWKESHIEAYRTIVKECQAYGAKVAIQIAHAGRKSTIENGDVVGPSPIPFSEGSPMPRELKYEEIKEIIKRFGESTRLAVKAGFDVIELHGAHGYLLHQFLSPRSNKRDDEYGEYERFSLDVIEEIRKNMPEEMPLILRISATEYGEEGYDFHHIKRYIPQFIEAGVNAFDVSTGGNSPNRPDVYPAYQVKYAEIIKKEFNIPVISVGGLEKPEVAANVIDQNKADMVAIGKGLLRHPYWPKEAAEALDELFELPGVYNLGYRKKG
jgi:NADPH2 dehydrogenase